ncbi:membrane-anchored ubiquitin-fold protein 1-like protein, partial [Tanacetum coccineum]
AANDPVAEWGDYNIAKALDSNSGREFDDSLIRDSIKRAANDPVAEKKSASNTVKDLKIISAGNIIENSRMVGECRSAMFDVPCRVATMHVVVSQPPQEKIKFNGPCIRRWSLHSDDGAYIL